jgi:hypothetical protein
MGEASEAKVFASRMRDDFFLAPLCTSVGGVCGCRTTDSSQYPERHRGKNIARIREDFVGLSGLTYKSECKCLILFISGEAKVRPNEAKQGQLFITSGEHGGI